MKVERTYKLTDRESRKLDKYLARVQMSESEFIGKRIEMVIKSVELNDEIDSVIKTTLEKLGGNEEEFYAGSNKMPNPTARRVVSYILRKDYGCKLVDIAKRINRDHSSIHSAIRWIEERQGLEKFNPDEFKTIAEIKEIFSL